MLYVIAGSLKGQDKKLHRGAAIVEVPDGLDDFTADMRALDQLPPACLAIRRGAHVAEAWPLESAEGTALAVAAGLAIPAPAIAEEV